MWGKTLLGYGQRAVPLWRNVSSAIAVWLSVCLGALSIPSNESVLEMGTSPCVYTGAFLPNDLLFTLVSFNVFRDVIGRVNT